MQQWLNYHHLLYFWLVAREGGLAKASAQLRLAPSTVSEQIRALETALDEKLFLRSGRNLVMTEIGRVVFRYADEIFGIGRELQDALRGLAVGRPRTLAVGVADVVPKAVARRLLEPALGLSQPVKLVCREAKPDRLLADLAVHELDVVLADTPVGPSIRIRAFSHLLGECGITFFGSASLARRARKGFPDSLDGTPMLLPTENTALRRSLDQWFNSLRIQPHVIAEFEDSALLKEFGGAGVGIFPVHALVASEVEQQFRLKRIGHTDDVRERFYAISIERRLEHPAVVAITEEARRALAQL